MTPREFLNALAILESIDDVPGMPSGMIGGTPAQQNTAIQMRVAEFRANPLRFFRRADDATQAVIWAAGEARRQRCGRQDRTAEAASMWREFSEQALRGPAGAGVDHD